MPKLNFYVRRLDVDDAEDIEYDDDCPDCDGRGDEDCMTCGGLGCLTL